MSSEITNRIILPGGELRLPDRDILGEDVLDFFSRYRAEFGIFGVAGVSEDGSLLDFHIAGENIKDLDKIVLDRMPGYNFKPVLESIEDRLVLLNGDQHAA